MHQESVPVLVPVLSLGRRVVATADGGVRAGSFVLGLADAAAGGRVLRPTALSADLFQAAAMRAVAKDLMAMKVAELKQGRARGARRGQDGQQGVAAPAAACGDCVRIP